MEGSDEARACAVLVEMQQRLIHGPHAALGVGLDASASDIRTAFLQLTKIFHPARFGRMSPDTQRLSNEVFLSLRAAHDTLAKPRPRLSAPTSPVQQTPPGPGGRGQTPTRPTPPPTTLRPTTTTPTPPTWPSLRPTTTTPTPPPSLRPTTTTPTPPPSLRPTTTTPTPPLSNAQLRTGPQQRMPSGPYPAVAVPRATTGGVPSGSNPTAVASIPPGSTGQVATRPHDPELAPIHDLMLRGQWEPARAAITVLAAKAPASPKYRALLSYTRGREAQLARRLDEARVELDTALQLDPDLQLAKTALAELFTRRK